MTFGSEIQRLRKQKGLKQYELAEKLGFKSAYLCDIENGRRKPQSNKFIENVCEVLKLTDKERKHLYELSYNLPENITNKKQELLSQVANMELRDQLEIKEQMINNLKADLKRAEVYLTNVEYETHALGGKKKYMERALLNIDQYCRDYFGD